MNPYFKARMNPAGFEVEGTPACQFGHRLPEGDGIFAAWSWDGERLTVTNDRYGFYPLFYSEREGEIAVSSSLAELVRRAPGTPPRRRRSAPALRGRGPQERRDAFQIGRAHV